MTGVPRGTLKDRYQGGQSYHTAHSNQQRLSPAAEAELTTWIRLQNDTGQAPSYLVVRMMAERLLREAGDSRPLGINWLYNFFNRNPTIKPMMEKRVEAERVEGLSQANIDDFVERLSAVIASKNIKTANIHNMDETGVAEGYGPNGCVVGKAELKDVVTRSSGNRVWTTILHSISAAGTHTTPVVIMEGDSIQSTHFPDIIPDPTGSLLIG